MANTNSGRNNSNSLISYHGHLPQVAAQNVDYDRRPAVAPPASCQSQNPIHILRLPEVLARIGLCRASIYDHMTRGLFPKQIIIGSRAVGWLEHEVDAWFALRMSARKQPPS